MYFQSDRDRLIRRLKRNLLIIRWNCQLRDALIQQDQKRVAKLILNIRRQVLIAKYGIDDYHNHIDQHVDELKEIVETYDHPWVKLLVDNNQLST